MSDHTDPLGSTNSQTEEHAFARSLLERDVAVKEAELALHRKDRDYFGR